MATTKSRRKDPPKDRRAGILNAARCVFARQGFADTVVDDIAGHAGIGKGTLYLYFGSKEEIFLATLLEDAHKLEESTRERMQAATAWEDKLRAYVDVRMEYLDAHQDFLRIYLAEVRARLVRGAKMDGELYHCIRESEGRLAQVFAAAIARNEIRPVDPELAATTLSDLTRGLMERRLLGWGRPDGSADVTFALDMVCRSLRPDPPPVA